ncbi:MAG: energy-coupling factor transporter ATPase [Lachnospiraceae bacterium]
MLMELSGIDYVYSPATVYEMDALKQVSLQIEQGEFIGLIGHTGSGKSTLIQLLNGLLQPTAGTVRFEGEDIWAEKYPIKELRSKVGLVFQYSENQLFAMSVMADVCFGPKNQGLSEEEAKVQAAKALADVGIDESVYNKSPFEISGGQKKRVAIAGVLAMNPQVLVLDEPTAGLDPRGRKQILDLITRLRRERGITIILVSHSMEDVASYADRLVVMNAGEIAFNAPPREVFGHYLALEKMGLSAPQITYIMHQLAERGLQVDTTAITVDEARTSILKALQKKQDNEVTT